MNIEEIQVFPHTNIYSLKEPVIRMTVRLGPVSEIPTKDMGDLNEKILEFFPGILRHKCSRGYAGGFVERLKEGTYVAHVAEHLCLELQTVLGYDVVYGKTRQVRDDVYSIVFSCSHPAVGKACGIFVINLLNCLTQGIAFDFSRHLEQLRQFCSNIEPGPSTRAIILEAKRRGIPVSEIDQSGIYRLGYGKYQKLMSATLYERTSCISVDMSCDKELTKRLLDDYNIPVPAGKKCRTLQQAVAVAEDLGYPIVMKPNKGSKGKDVFIKLSDEQELASAYTQAVGHDGEVLVEKYISGHDFRLLVINGKFVAAAQRIPAMVLGDGRHTVKELIDRTNSDSLRGEDHEKPLTKIKTDENTLLFLQKQGLNLFSVPEKGRMVRLRETANLSTGGMAYDCTERVHPANIMMAEQAVQAVGLDIGGVDIVSPDISLPLKPGFGAVVEVNAAPGIRMHLYPSKGQPRDVVSPILDMAFPKGEPFSVPIIAVTGTNGKTTTTRMISHILKVSGLNVGYTSTHGIIINGQCVEKGDTTGPKSAQRVLHDRTIDAAVLETARGGIIRAGLAYDKADVAVFTNLTCDHLGLDGIETMEDMFHVKSLVTEAVKDSGTCVLNADDSWVVKAMEKAGGGIILYSLRFNNAFVIQHIKNGGTAIYAENGYICISKGGSAVKLVKIREIPLTMEGVLEHNIYNSMASIGACLALGIAEVIIKTGLKTFLGDSNMNPGRFNVFDVGQFKVVLDYGHNVDGYTVTIEALKKIQHSKLLGVIGVPGDRRDEDIQRIGFISATSFDRLLIKEDRDPRGRRPLEVAELLRSGALEAGMRDENIEIIPDEAEALERALKYAGKDDVVTVFFENMEPLVDIIKAHQAAGGTLQPDLEKLLFVKR